ncbi:MAG: energy-coupling factor transporter transmembrane component T family protein [Sphaerochaetaceae bacterium]
MAEVVLFHYTQRSTFLHKAHPLTKMAALFLFSTGLTLFRLQSSLLIFLFLMIISYKISLPLTRYFKEIRFFFFIGLVMALVRFINTHLISEFFVVLLRFFSIVLLGLLFTDSTSSDDAARAIGSFLSPLFPRKGPRIASTIELTLHTIPLILDTAAQVREARVARLEPRWRAPLKRMINLGRSLLEELLQKAQHLELALVARHYDPSALRSSLRFSTIDITTLFISCVILISAYVLQYVQLPF